MSQKARAIVIAIIAVIGVLLLMGLTDSLLVGGGHYPLFCIETAGSHYVGVWYSFDIYPHPITGEMQHAMYIFGIPIVSTFTN